MDNYKCHKTKKIDDVAQEIIDSPSQERFSLSPHILPLLQVADSEQSEEVHVDEIPLQQETERQKTLAATKNQSAYPRTCSTRCIKETKNWKDKNQLLQ